MPMFKHPDFNSIFKTAEALLDKKEIRDSFETAARRLEEESLYYMKRIRVERNTARVIVSVEVPGFEANNVHFKWDYATKNCTVSCSYPGARGIAKIVNFTIPKDAGSVVTHHVSNGLAVIQFAKVSEEKKEASVSNTCEYKVGDIFFLKTDSTFIVNITKIDGNKITYAPNNKIPGVGAMTTDIAKFRSLYTLIG